MTSIFLLATALSAGNVEFDRRASEGAAQISARRAAAEIARKGPEAGTLAGAMLANPGAHAEKAASQEASRKLFDVQTKAAYEAACREILRGLSLPGNFSLPYLTNETARLNATFVRLFEDERKKAVHAQATNIVATIRPSEAEMETTPYQQLLERMTERIIKGQKNPVFEENKPYISQKIAAPIIGAGNHERNRQHHYLMIARCTSAAPSKLKQELTDKLKANVAENRAKAKDPQRTWGIFPSVFNTGLTNAVERRTMNRLISKITNTKKLEINPADVEKQMRERPLQHVKVADSEKAFSEAYAKKVLDPAFRAALTNDVSPNEQRELENFLRPRLEADTVKQAVSRIVRRDLLPVWKTVRETMTTNQFAKVWPSLADGTWFPDAEVTDETVMRDDYAMAVRYWRMIAGLQRLASADRGKVVFEETSLYADAKVAQAFNRARSAVGAQTRAVEKAHPVLLKEWRDAEKTPSLGEIVDRLTTTTEKAWEESREKVLWPDGEFPKNKDKQHVELFPSVQRKIELVAKAILQELTKPHTGTTHMPVDVPIEEQNEFAISVLRVGDKVEVRLLKNNLPVYERSMDAKRAPYDSAMKEVVDRLGRDFLKLR